jgi:hypothetical protein
MLLMDMGHDHHIIHCRQAMRASPRGRFGLQRRSRRYRLQLIHWINIKRPNLNTSFSSRGSQPSFQRRVFSFSTSSCGHRHFHSDQWRSNGDHQIVMLMSLNPFVQCRKANAQI